MDKESALLLFAQGREAWNLWAEDMRDRKATESDQLETADVDFSETVFPTGTDWTGFIFPGRVSFRACTFEGETNFTDCQFDLATNFMNVRWHGDCKFKQCTFSESVDFSSGKSLADYFIVVDCRIAGYLRLERFGGPPQMWIDQVQVGGKLYFYEARLGQLRFLQCDLRHEVDLSGTCLTGSLAVSACQLGGQFTLWKASGGNLTFDSSPLDNGCDLSFSRWDYVDLFDLTVGRCLFSKLTAKRRFLVRAVTFFADAYIEGAQIGDLELNEVTFCKEMQLSRALVSGHFFAAGTRFLGIARLDEIKIAGWTDLSSISASTGFLLDSAEFQEVPFFRQAHFAVPPSIDNIQIRAKTSTPDAWRALRGIAAASQDHVNARRFFVNEMKARRGKFDRLWHSQYWIGWAYEIASDFGRSLSRPILCWLTSIGLFALIYYGGIPTSERPCLKGTGSQWEAALNLSARRSVIIARPDDAGTKRQQICLFGQQNPEEPNSPETDFYVAAAQTAVSTTLLFLFLLAVRHHFRISD